VAYPFCWDPDVDGSMPYFIFIFILASITQAGPQASMSRGWLLDPPTMTPLVSPCCLPHLLGVACWHAVMPWMLHMGRVSPPLHHVLQCNAQPSCLLGAGVGRAPCGKGTRGEPRS
jgi:hypothetical protein